MKGVILCGGMGTRLRPLTNIINKHLLPVWDRPMISWPIRSMVQSGINQLLMVCGGPMAGEYLRVLGNGEDFGLKHLDYTYQKEAGGIAHALSLARDWADDDPICVMLGDNILQNDFAQAVENFNSEPAPVSYIFTTEVKNPEWYGVVEADDSGEVKSLVEKPKNPKSNTIAIGLYMYDRSVWKHIDSLAPSARNELEITDLNNIYLNLGLLKSHKINGWWGDAGESIDTYVDTCIKARELFKNEIKPCNSGCGC